MPIYEYVCSKCGHQMDVLQKVDEKAPVTCDSCGAKKSLSRKVSAPSFVLKGGGWYKDLYSSTKKDGGSSESSSSSTSSSTSSAATSAPPATASAPATPAAKPKSKGKGARK